MGLKYHLAVAAVAALALAGCGGAADKPPSSGEPPTQSGLPAACLDEKTIGAVLGFPVHVEPATVKQSADAVNCTFLADDQAAKPGVNVSILVAPDSFAAQALQDITDSAARAGTSTTAVSVGKKGIAYESAERSAAAAVVGGKLVGVTLDGMGLSSPGAARTIVVDLLGKVAGKLGGTQPQAAALPAPSSRPRRSNPPPVTKPSSPPQSQEPQSKEPKPSGKPSGQLVFDPFSAIACTWVPRMFVDLSGGSKPGIDVRVPLMASQVDAQATVTIRSELNGSLSHASTTVTVGPDWRGSAHLALAAPAFGNFVSIATELDTEGRLAGRTVRDSRRTVEGMIPDPRPGGEQRFGCNPVP